MTPGEIFFCLWARRRAYGFKAVWEPMQWNDPLWVLKARQLQLEGAGYETQISRVHVIDPDVTYGGLKPPVET